MSRLWFSRHVVRLGTDGALLPPPFCACLLVRPPSWLKTVFTDGVCVCSLLCVCTWMG